MSEVRISIRYAGQTLLVGGEVHGPDPSAGILGDYVEELNLYNPETEELLSEEEHDKFDDNDWDEISGLFLADYVPDYD